MSLTADLGTSTSFDLGPARALSCRECGHETPLAVCESSLMISWRSRSVVAGLRSIRASVIRG